PEPHLSAALLASSCRHHATFRWRRRSVRIRVEETHRARFLEEVRVMPFVQAPALARDDVTAAVAAEEAIAVAFIQIAPVGVEDRHERAPCLPIQPIDFGKLLKSRKRQCYAALTQQLFRLQEDAADDVGRPMKDPSGIEEISIRPPSRLGLRSWGSRPWLHRTLHLVWSDQVWRRQVSGPIGPAPYPQVIDRLSTGFLQVFLDSAGPAGQGSWLTCPAMRASSIDA